MGSKYLKDLEARKTKIIHVYPNGDSFARATFIVLRQLEQKDLERIIRAVEEKVRLPLNRPIRKLFEMSGVVVKSFIQIEDGKYYVAASAENFFPLEYGHGVDWVMVGPVRTSKYANVRFVTRSEEEGAPKGLTSSTNMLSSTKDTKERISTKKSPIKKSPAGLKKEDKLRTPKKIMAASEHTDSVPSVDRVNGFVLEGDSNRPVVADENIDLVEDHQSPHIVEHVGIDENNKFDSKEECPKADEDEHSISRKEIDGENDDGYNKGVHRDVKEEPATEEDSSHYKYEDKDEDSLNIRETKDEYRHEEKENVGEMIDEDRARNIDDANERRQSVEYNEDVVKKEVSPEDAAAKIQAAFRGHLKRKEQNGEEQNTVDDNTDVSEEINSQKEN